METTTTAVAKSAQQDSFRSACSNFIILGLTGVHEWLEGHLLPVERRIQTGLA